ncbi:MAG: MBL fold metallo-hydrolase [Candidatus Altiarchaeota archaeon]
MIVPLISYSSGSNCFLVYDQGNSVVVDSGIDPEPVLRAISELRITLDSLINTHAHYDHVKGNEKLVESSGCEVFVHKIDAEVLESGNDTFILSELFGDLIGPQSVDRKLKGGDELKIGGLSLMVLHTPGHTKGSICLYCPKEKALFTGDTVFSDGVGRTDLPGGDFGELKKSMEKLISFSEEFEVEKIFPGHGPVGKVGDIQNNYNIYF